MTDSSSSGRGPEDSRDSTDGSGFVPVESTAFVPIDSTALVPLDATALVPLDTAVIAEADARAVSPRRAAAEASGEPLRARQPRSAPTKREKRTPWITLAIGVVVLGGALGTVAFAGAGNAGPGAQVSTYLNNLVEGRAGDALNSVTGTSAIKNGVLLTDKAYEAATNHIIGYTVGEPTIDGDKATVVATIIQGSASYKQTFTLSKVGKTFLVFDDWKISNVPLNAVSVSFSGPPGLTVQVNGAPLAAKLTGADAVALPAFPGDYAVTVPKATGNYAGGTGVASVVGFTEAASGPVLARAVITLSDTGTAAANAALDAWLDACAAQPVLAPVGCGFAASPDPGLITSDIVWTVTTRPTSTFAEWSETGFPVVSATTGRLDLLSTVTRKGAGRSGTYKYAADLYAYHGSISFVDGAAVFTPSA